MNTVECWSRSHTAREQAFRPHLPMPTRVPIYLHGSHLPCLWSGCPHLHAGIDHLPMPMLQGHSLVDCPTDNSATALPHGYLFNDQSLNVSRHPVFLMPTRIALQPNRNTHALNPCHHSFKSIPLPRHSLATKPHYNNLISPAAACNLLAYLLV